MSIDLPMLLASSTPAAATQAVAQHAAKTDYLALVFVFMLATFTGLLVIRNVSRLLHTPLMSLTNAISAIAVVGSIVLAGMPAISTAQGDQYSVFTTFLGAVAVFASMTNIVSGFLLTDRMLKMFKKREPGQS
jgi:H+-translocating NAD(P) transhydrogenase subunit alpha